MVETTKPESLRIFLVEDNAADARILQETLKEMPFPTQLDMVEDGEAALVFLRRYAPHDDAPRPDLILLDLHLPRKNGSVPHLLIERRSLVIVTEEIQN